MSIQLKIIINIQYFIIDREKVIFTFVKKYYLYYYLRSEFAYLSHSP